MPPKATGLLPPAPLTPRPTPGYVDNFTQVEPGKKDVLPEIVTKLEQLSEGFDETNKLLGDYREIIEDSRTAFAKLLSQQEKEHDRSRSQFIDSEYSKQLQSTQALEESAISRLGRTVHWQGKFVLASATNTQLQQTQEATTRQAAAVTRGADTSARQAADIARAANTFERVANTLDRVADPVQSLFGNTATTMRSLLNWVINTPLDR